MPRNMSFALTKPQIVYGSKTVTRRTGWVFLRPGDIVQAVTKSMGLKKGEKVERLRRLRVVDVSREPLDAITAEDVTAEGFPGRDPEWFIDFFLRENTGNGLTRGTVVTRIEFEYID